ncbi:MAG: hypothetical protein FJX80_04465 [Bacteroidetes bacterium]|nr:hypothetical protein [Bacteroidota bacterium]
MRNLLPDKKIANALTLVVLLSFYIPSYGQLGGYTNKGRIPAEPGIDLLVQNVQNPCGGGLGAGIKKTAFKLKMSGIRNKYVGRGLKSDLVLEIRFVNCKGIRELKKFTIDLNRYNADGENSNPSQWFFEGATFSSFKAEVKQVQETASLPCTISLPTSIYASRDNIKPGEAVTLSISGDGKLCGKNSKWVWYREDYANPNPSNILLSSPSSEITVSPNKTTTYFLRGQDGKTLTGGWISKTINVLEAEISQKEKNKTPARKSVVISGAPTSPICKGEKINLKVSGGLEQPNKSWRWHINDCDGTVVSENEYLSSYTVNETITIYVRDEYDKEVKDCKSIRIEVKPTPVLANLSINNGAKSITICEGEQVELKVSGKGTGVTQLKWFKDDPTSYSISSIDQYSTYPKETTIYYVKGEGDCKSTTNLATVKVNVTKKSIAPNYITATKLKGKNYRLTAEGGSLESGANWKWYAGNNCSSGNPIGEGSEITSYNTKNGNVVSVKAEGGNCGESSCISHIISTPSASAGFGFINVGILDLTFSNFSIAVGSKKFYFRYKTGIKSVSATQDISYDNTFGYTIPTYPINATDYYEFNGQKSVKRSGYTAGVMIGGKSVRFYLGGGLGEVTPSWGVDIVNYANPSSKTSTWGTVNSLKRKGPEVEAGLFFKVGKFNIMAGANVINDKSNGQYIDGTLGVGITF